MEKSAWAVCYLQLLDEREVGAIGNTILVRPLMLGQLRVRIYQHHVGDFCPGKDSLKLFPGGVGVFAGHSVPANECKQGVGVLFVICLPDRSEESCLLLRAGCLYGLKWQEN